MNKSKQSIRIFATRVSLLGAAITAALSSVAWAEEKSQATKDDSIETIQVTATKRTQVIYEVPLAISAFSGDALAEQGISDLTDVGKFVPNLNVTGFSAGHTSSANPFIRGIGLQDHLITTDPGVSVYVDGVYLGRQVGQNWNLSNIERIEVLRGPQGTLYGRNSIGGAINIITKQPDEVAVTKVVLEAGSRGRAKGDVFVNRELTDTLAFNFNAGYNQRDGLGEFINVPDAEYDVGETQEAYGRFSVKFTPNDDFSLVFTADGNDGEGGLRPYTVLIDEVPNGAYYTGMRFGAPTPTGPLRNSDLAPNIYDNATGTREVTTVSNEASGLSLTADWSLNDELSTKAVLSNRTSEYKAGLDDDGTIYALDHYPERGDADQTSAEWQLSGFYGDMDFVSGLYWFEEKGSNRQGEDSRFNGGANTLELDQTSSSRAVFANVGYQLTDDLRLAGGLRFNKDKKDVVANVGIGPFAASDEWSQMSYDLSASYRMENGMNLYGTIQSGYQSGQFPARPYCLFGNPECLVASDNITAVNYEMGIKGQVTDTFSMSIAVFNTVFDDLPYQVSTTAEGGFSTTNLVVSQTSRGIEWESTVYFSNAFKLHSALGWIDVDVDEKDGVKPVAPLTPELTAAIGPSYEFALASGASVTARIDYSFRDEMYGEPSSDPGRLTQIDSRELVNMDIAYSPASGDWTVALYGHNIFDERYDNARLNTGDYILRILSNDASEFGVRYTAQF
ncbi:MAG: TonB-dependent receptor [Gammaproteobacteria bacterium]|nr:TonB-dependent receptor [Gammaproteobacteria bacterium]MBU2057709.1 TonB-dependent receptor [Gammaproteobacteria bacterium]MBU2176409.1 TonB-dependent receptor [Gammaproteobacteria bacterium]MBU2246706.1 TonB-dependent receptor [Gammaproteobacteria bacterium]MBU2345070.1 TonB-dependent receptor [Gammaproteobacteria bacterium]